MAEQAAYKMAMDNLEKRSEKFLHNMRQYESSMDYIAEELCYDLGRDYPITNKAKRMRLDSDEPEIVLRSLRENWPKFEVRAQDKEEIFRELFDGKYESLWNMHILPVLTEMKEDIPLVYKAFEEVIALKY